MRVLLDANIYLSYLLAPDASRTITDVVRACFTPAVELLMPEELLDEIAQVLAGKPYFRERVTPEALERLMSVLQASGLVPERLHEMASYSPDPDDDYLVAYGLVYDVEYLVTGDPHLLALGRVGYLAIVDPRTFWDLLALQPRL